uniref:Major facilitator superfamily (MFS) profile domain-containing protein n=1 Tax=Panagrolaimus davidi TaxID=227884 RepID=A0A914QEY7_9BILA
MYNSTTSITYGCNTDKFTWCQKLRPVNVYLYYTAYVIALGFAFPVLNITVATIFSKILGPRRQGTQQGIFQASGSAARTIGPIAVSMLYTKYGPQMAWNMEIAVIAVTLLVWLIFYRRMVASKIPTPDPEICKILNANDAMIISDFKPRTMTHKTLTSCKTI